MEIGESCVIPCSMDTIIFYVLGAFDFSLLAWIFGWIPKQLFLISS